MLKIAVLVLFYFTVAVTEGIFTFVTNDNEIEVIPNPYGHSKSSACASIALQELLQPNQLIITPMQAQPDTLQEVTYLKVFTVPIPIYSMKQPIRISEAELKFHLVLVKSILPSAENLIHEHPVPMVKAMDSWFPGYYWTPIMMSCGKGDSFEHVGWKFTSVDGNAETPHFYALMVQTENKEKAPGLRIAGFALPAAILT